MRKRARLILRAAVEDGAHPPYRVPGEAPFRFAFALGDRRYSTPDETFDLQSCSRRLTDPDRSSGAVSRSLAQ
jgi:hypothetical protein